MKFNISLIQPTGYIHSLALLEAAEYIFYKLKNHGYDVQLVKNRVYPTGINIIFGAHIHPEKNLDFPQNTLIFNTEQLPENSNWINKDYKEILEKNFVWDYSKTNLDLISHPNKGLVNFYYEKMLNRISLDSNKPYDLAFYGSINDRRKVILDKLIAKGLKVKVIFGLYSKERDEAIKDCKAVLNLHFYENKIFQQIRAFYPLINAIPVISENFPTESAPEIYQNVLFTPNENDFCDFVFKTLKDLSLFNAKAKEKLSIFEKYIFEDEFNIALNTALDYFNSEKLSGIQEEKFTKINLGSGKDYKRGYLNIDLRKEVLPDILLDLSNRISFPVSERTEHFGLIELAEDQFDEITANDVLEHVPNLETLMGNCLNLLKTGGKFIINVPYELSYGAWQDPTHIRGFNQNSWLYYTEWFWYLGWFKFRFHLSELNYTLSTYGQELLKNGVDERVLVLTPRAIDSMRVVLTKIETTPEERTTARSFRNSLID